VARYGAGTERIEHELREALDVPVFRLDADTATAKDAVPELLARFQAAPAGLLLGTQMVAKGHDFPDVSSTPTRRCGSPTSGRRSARSR
jgi:primosomal protein N' (replication factor Y)